jgi:acetyl-CoA carboxylase biotin carboxyl carrier protein
VTDEEQAGNEPIDEETILAAVDRLATQLGDSPLDELEMEVGDLRVRVARPHAPAVAPVPAPELVAGPPAAPAIPSSPYGEPAPGNRFVTAPLTGVWYTAPSPGARSYVSIGDEIASGQVVGLIEAMKLFNEIKADTGGTVTRILAESGTLVKRQQPLLEVDPR